VALADNAKVSSWARDMAGQVQVAESDTTIATTKDMVERGRTMIIYHGSTVPVEVPKIMNSERKLGRVATTPMCRFLVNFAPLFVGIS